ncbi:hypothetical protein [Streptomyces sp. NPDC005438]|uniref:SWIM zinc finger family protein n=1 Tax=Streptomyces sp. NPDC005438 TaxID=3156880 RepID=UPI0033B40155
MTGGPSPARELTFAPPPPPRGRAFAHSWWARGWVAALEESSLDQAALRSGRSRARAGSVGAVTVRPGRATAVVRDRDGSAHRADLLLPVLTADHQARLRSVVAGEAGHLAALLDGELPDALAEDALAAGVELLPGVGELEPECGCGGWDHCAHTTALGYQLARALDGEPLALLLLRGLTEERLRHLADEDGIDGAERPDGPPGQLALEAYRLTPAPLPPPPEVEEAPHPVSLYAETEPDGLDVAALEFLARAASVRAGRLLRAALAGDWAERGPGDEDRDRARLLALGPPPQVVTRLTTG